MTARDQMTRARRAPLIGLAGLAFLTAMSALGCGGGSQATRPVGPRGASGAGNGPGPSGDPSTTLVRASAAASTKDEAHRAAVARLEAEIYGSEGSAAWAKFLALSPHDPARDPMRSTSAGGTIEVELGMARERVAEFFDELARTTWDRPAPDLIARTLQQIYPIYVQRFVCERRKALLGDECTPPALDQARAALEALSRTVTLRPHYAGGVPLGAAGQPLRPITVVVEMATPAGVAMPLAGVPVKASTTTEDILQSARAESDAAGMASFDLRPGAAWPDEVRVALDSAALFGPMAGDWPGTEVFVKARKTSAHRWAVVSRERVQGRTAKEGLVAASLARSLRAAGAGSMVALPADAVARLSASKPRQLGESLPGLADAWGGRVDVLVVVELDSDYASRMGAHRVWYEARGRVDVYDVWTGKQLATVEASGTASDVGDERADRAARIQFAESLATKLQQEAGLVFRR
jgi:hypothetical protein